METANEGNSCRASPALMCQTLRVRFDRVITTIVLTTMVTACAVTPAAGEVRANNPQRLNVQVLQTLPHDASLFTEGLEYDGTTLYESAGLSGQSTLTAGPLGGPVAIRAILPSPLFAEGITVVGTTIWQLTWQDGVAIQWDKATLRELRRVPFRGEGWGLCYQPSAHRLVMSNGSSSLTFRDPDTFAVTGTVQVGRSNLNELECVGDTVYANVFDSDDILRIDSSTGLVTGVADASALLQPRPADPEAVLNGIAAVPGTDQFLVTGKFWPTMYRVRFVPSS
jgi:glutamine cyclotransferase